MAYSDHRVWKQIVKYSNIRMSQQRTRISMYYIIGPHVMFTCLDRIVYSMASSNKSRPLRSPVWEYFEIVGEKVCCKVPVIVHSFSGFSVGFCINEEKVICYQLELGK